MSPTQPRTTHPAIVLTEADRATIERLRRAASLKRQFKEMARSIGALMLRETVTRFGNRRLGYLWAFIEPAGFILLFMGVRLFIGRGTPFGESIALFLITGLVTARMVIHVMGRLGPSIRSNRALLTYPLVQPLDTIFARGAVEVLTATTVIVTFFVGLQVVMNRWVIHDFADFTLVTLVTLALALSLGMLHAVMSALYEAWDSVFGFVRLPLFLASAVFYMPAVMPPKVQAVLWWNPILHCVEWYRDAIYMDYQPLLDRSYPVAFAAICLFLSLWLERTYRLRLSTA